MLKLIIGILEKLEILERNSNKSGMNFVRMRTLSLIKNQYHHVVFDGFNDRQCCMLLKEFDLELKNKFPLYYNKLEDVSILQWHFFKFSYIAELRRCFSTRTLRFLLYWLLVWAGNMGHTLKKLVRKNNIDPN